MGCCLDGDHDPDKEDDLDRSSSCCYDEPMCCMGRPASRGGRVVFFNRKGRLENFYEDANAALGEGSFGQVRLVRNRQSLLLRALKTLPKYDDNGEPQDIEGAQRELEIISMSYTDHPHVARLFETFEDEKALYLVTEYCSGGDLMDRLKDGAKADWRKGRGYNVLSESFVADVLRQAVAAVAHLHALGIVHGDVKPANFCFFTSAPDASLKLIDFGSAKFSFSKTQSAVLGTPDYAAPEMLEAFLDQRLHMGVYTAECPVDIWAIGIMMHLMLTGTMPPSANRKILFMDPVKFVELQLEILNAHPPYDFDSPEWIGVSPDAKEFLVCLLQLSPMARPTAAEASKKTWIKQSTAGMGQHMLDNKLAMRLTAFARRDRLEQAVFGLVADRIRESAEMQPIRDIWNSLDDDGDGLVSLQDFDTHIAQTNLELPSGFREALTAIAGESGLVELNQFLAATLEPQKIKEQQFARHVFLELDLNGTGRIHGEDLINLLGEDCGVGDSGLTEAQFYELLDQGARRIAPLLQTSTNSPVGPPAQIPSAPCSNLDSVTPQSIDNSDCHSKP